MSMLHSHSRHFRWTFSTTLRTHRPRSTHRPLSIRRFVICRFLRFPYLFKTQNNAIKYWSVWTATRNNWFRLIFGIQRCHDVHIVWTNCSAISRVHSSKPSITIGRPTCWFLRQTDPNQNFEAPRCRSLFGNRQLHRRSFAEQKTIFRDKRVCGGLLGLPGSQHNLVWHESNRRTNPNDHFPYQNLFCFPRPENDCRSRSTIAHGFHDAFHTPLLRAFYTQKCLFRLARIAFICTFTAGNDGQLAIGTRSQTVPCVFVIAFGTFAATA